MGGDAGDRALERRWRDARRRAGELFVPSGDLLVDGCGNCFSSEHLALLGGDPAAVPDDLVRRFASKDPGHWQAGQYEVVWQRLTPRVMTLLEHDPNLELGLVFRGLSAPQAGFAGWPAARRVALLDALEALLQLAVARWAPDRVLGLLDAATVLHHDVTAGLAQIEGAHGRAADAGFVRLAWAWSTDLLWGEEPSWWCPDDPTPLLRAWLSSAAVRRRVGAYAAAHPGCKTAADALAATEALRRNAPSPWRWPEYAYRRMATGGLDALNSFLRPLPAPAQDIAGPSRTPAS